MIPQRIVAIGTSSFFGLGDPQHGGYIGRLKVWHESKNNNNVIFNLGISGNTLGETTTQLLQRLVPETKVREPNLILLTSGINDIRRHSSRQNPPITLKEEFRNNIVNMIRQARSLADVIVISTFPIKEKHDSADNYLLPSDLEKYTQIVKTVCQQEKVPYLDIYNEWAKEDYSQFLIEDGVHANEKGHENIFLKLKEFLEKNYQ